ncbi:11729_t:CDS:2, partial [Racocetra persica]
HNINLIEEETISIKIEISEEDPDQVFEIIEEIYLGVKKDTRGIFEIIIDMIEADQEIIIYIIEVADNKEATFTNYWDTLLNNTSIRGALANYLQEEEYEDEELISHKAYTLEAESNNIEDPR